MPANQIHPELKNLSDSLEGLGKKIVSGWNNDQLLVGQWGWNLPAVSRHSLARFCTELADLIKNSEADSADKVLLARIGEATNAIEQFKTSTLPQFYNGNGAQAIPAFITLILSIRNDLEPVIGWQTIRSSSQIPAKMARRIRSYEATLDEISPNKDELARRIKLINEATESAESLPTDLAALVAARNKINDLQNKAEVLHEKMGERIKEANASSERLKNLENDAAKVVSQCEEAYRIATSKGLAAAFDQRAKSLSNSMWIWVGGLIAALATGYFLGSDRLKNLTDLLNEAQKSQQVVWPTVILALISLGGPIWLAWIATKQIGQRFRLAEDYGFKASVAKAYEGYRKEAARIDKGLEARLFASALTRLEEAPLRLVEIQTHGSPWHEFIESEGFQNALRTIPAFRDQFNNLRKKTGRATPENESGSAEVKK